MNIHYLMIIQPFDTLEVPLLEFQDKLFRNTGWSSTRALTPVIPLFYLKEEPPPGKLREILHRPCFPLIPEKLTSYKGCLFLKVEEQELAVYINLVKKKLTPWLNVEEQGPLPLFPGFFLACQEDKFTGRIDLRAVEGKKFPAYTVALLVLHRKVEINNWWRHLEWEITGEVKSIKGTSKNYK